MEDGKAQDMVDAIPRISGPDIAYMDSALDILEPELPVMRVRKLKSFPCMLLLNWTYTQISKLPKKRTAGLNRVACRLSHVAL